MIRKKNKNYVESIRKQSSEFFQERHQPMMFKVNKDVGNYKVTRNKVNHKKVDDKFLREEEKYVCSLG